MTARSRWDETRALIEEGQRCYVVTCDDCGGEGGFYTPESPHSKWSDPTPGERWDDCPSCHGSGWISSPEPPATIEQDDMPPPREAIDWADIKRAEADADRQMYGGMFAPQREDE